MSFGLRCNRRFNHTVLGALDRVIGPTSQEVSSIDNDSIFDGGSVNESVVRRQNLQSTPIVLEE